MSYYGYYIGKSLSPRERELLLYVAYGKTNNEIAMIFGLSNLTVKNHVQKILGKMGVETRTAVACEAFRRGLLIVRDGKVIYNMEGADAVGGRGKEQGGAGGLAAPQQGQGAGGQAAPPRQGQEAARRDARSETGDMHYVEDRDAGAAQVLQEAALGGSAGGPSAQGGMGPGAVGTAWREQFPGISAEDLQEVSLPNAAQRQIPGDGAGAGPDSKGEGCLHGMAGSMARGSPCTGICKLGEDGRCIGCGRTASEIEEHGK